MNEWTSAILCLAILCLVWCVVFLSRQLANASRNSERRADRAMDHAFAFNEDQRSFMRDRFDADMAREPRDTGHPHAGHDRGIPMPPNDNSDGLIKVDIPYEG